MLKYILVLLLFMPFIAFSQANFTSGGGEAVYSSFSLCQIFGEKRITSNISQVQGVQQPINALIMSTKIMDNDLKIYPNPFKSYIYINKEVKYSLYTASGRLIAKGLSNKINTSTLVSGLYLLKVEENIYKLIK